MRVKKDGTGKTNVGPPSFMQLKDIRIYSSKSNLPGVTPAIPVELDRDHVFVRLNSNRGQTATSGFVEVYANGEWGTVCDDNWDDKDAAVVCRMLGFGEVGAIATSDAEFGSGHGIISMSNVNCQGTEHHLLDCGITKDNWAHQYCSHDEDAGVMCIVDNTVNDFLLFTDSTTGFINRMDLKTHSYVSLMMTEVTKPVALTFNPVDRRLYFSNIHTIPDSHIFSSKLDATGQKLVMHFPRDSEIDGLAVDGHMEKLFYTDAGRKIIASCNLDGSNETVIVDTLLDKPRAIVLDTDNSVMYWTDWGPRRRLRKSTLMALADRSSCPKTLSGQTVWLSTRSVSVYESILCISMWAYMGSKYTH
ncbi:low-density lipoprotein receptor-related protein 4-like isoform X2 [Pomacea canaliculata]|uniref:low-density lipoprotein receptor-related protein 4-like isoform X2 n=1 Tax=Pomacea canaliculata TaxID=400727 RepID=UPI000D726F51|nr:low-density lipoprotein receptor-related protein 4-like isoform X2 [Pomacea canaliculata]